MAFSGATVDVSILTTAKPQCDNPDDEPDYEPGDDLGDDLGYNPDDEPDHKPDDEPDDDGNSKPSPKGRKDGDSQASWTYKNGFPRIHIEIQQVHMHVHMAPETSDNS
ncbi:hypothetical protein ACHAPJ_002518 [Fusarium lateritium]